MKNEKREGGGREGGGGEKRREEANIAKKSIPRVRPNVAGGGRINGSVSLHLFRFETKGKGWRGREEVGEADATPRALLSSRLHKYTSSHCEIAHAFGANVSKGKCQTIVPLLFALLSL